MRTLSVQKACATEQPITRDHVHDLGSRYGLALAGGGRSPYREVREVAWLVEDQWNDFKERVVAWRTITVFLAGAAQMRDLEVLDDLYTSKDDYLYSAEWRLMFVLNHLEGSGLAIVRMPTP
ncbi:hypothetical protein JNB_04670 [Janibacter sp. HTCC2649]|uniref:hypothetical protein n=1 Tax=Janibacter sp. HTCC2649 TaxID=313589 RepID=UPI000066EC89|nr:hypothetical protein [Janibacter sp. HTCC2649]EAP99436.1 hypothetical protein JNB_04670 [Janibacter sp. HTCC2649]